MNKEKRIKEIKLRKNFFLTLLITILLWLLLATLIYFTDPADFGVIFLFFILTLSSLTFTLSIILINARRGFLLSLVLTFYLLLRYFGVGNILNFLLLTGVGIAIEIYFTKK